MKVGQYVRCPIVFEENDNYFPRNFMLGKITSINDLSGEVNVKLYDLKDSKRFYAHAFENGVSLLLTRSRDVARQKMLLLLPLTEGARSFPEGLNKQKMQCTNITLCFPTGRLIPISRMSWK